MEITNIFDAVEKGETELAKVFANEIKFKTQNKINLVDMFGKTVLYYACERGNVELVEFFLMMGANPNIRGFARTVGGNSCLEAGFLSDNPIQITRLLLIAGAKVYSYMITNVGVVVNYEKAKIITNLLEKALTVQNIHKEMIKKEMYDYITNLND